MALYAVPDELKQRPGIQIAPLIDVIFITLIFFVTLSVFYQLESELSVSVPRAAEAKETLRTPGEIIINVLKDGTVVVNQKRLSDPELSRMLRRVSELFPNQPVVIRADRKAYHEHVIKVLDACASADIWNVAFAAIKEEPAK